MKIEFNVKGTEKQVKWCKDILKDFNAFFQTLEDREIFKEIMSDKDGKFYDIYTRCYEIVKVAVQMINNENASFIIDNRDRFQKTAFESNFKMIYKFNEFIAEYSKEKKIGKYSRRFLDKINIK